MYTLEALKKIEASVADILDAAKTIPTNRAHTCDWIDDQMVSPEQYLEWAEISLKGGDDRELVSAVAHSKRAACRVIDSLIQSYYLEYAKTTSYPVKIEGLTSIGIEVDSIIQELTISPRNELEHTYRVPESGQAKHAVQVAKLFVQTMREEFNREPIIAFNGNLLYRVDCSRETGAVTKFNGLSKNPMFFIDVFESQTEIKIVDPQAAEVRYTRLSDFSREDCLTLGMYLRSHYTHKNQAASGMTKTVYEALKSQAGF